MINELFNSISKKIDEIFPKSSIYFNKIEQGFLTPAFFVRCLKVEETKMISNRYKILTSFEITYFHECDFNVTEENNQILQYFISSFELLPFQNGLLRSQNINFNTDDDYALKITLDYNFYINKTQEEPEKMQNLFY